MDGQSLVAVASRKLTFRFSTKAAPVRLQPETGDQTVASLLQILFYTCILLLFDDTKVLRDLMDPFVDFLLCGSILVLFVIQSVILERIFVRGVTCARVYRFCHTISFKQYTVRLFISERQEPNTRFDWYLRASVRSKCLKIIITQWLRTNKLLIRSFFTSTSVRNILMIFLIQVKELKKAECKLFEAEDARCFLVRDRWHDSIKRCGWKKRELHFG